MHVYIKRKVLREEGSEEVPTYFSDFVPLEVLQNSSTSTLPPELISWDNYKGSPMLELWTARTRSREEPQMQH